MASIFDRVSVGTATTGTGDITLGSATPKYRTFLEAGIPNATEVPYVIEDGLDWEIGTGIYSTPAETLQRTVISSSNSNSPLNLSGNATVFVSLISDIIAAVTLTNDYDDLDNKPTLGTAAAADTGDFATAAQGGLADTAVQPTAIADMLETGDIGTTVQAYDADTAKTDVDQSWTGSQRPSTPTTLTISTGEIAWTLASRQDFQITMNDDGELQLPSDIATHVGQRGRIMFTQDGTGGHTLTVDAGFEVLNSDTLPEILQDPNAKTICFYDVIAADTVLLAFGGVGASL